MITREQILNYINKELNYLEELIERKHNYTAYIDATELEGIIRTAYIFDLITENEHDALIKQSVSIRESTGIYLTRNI